MPKIPKSKLPKSKYGLLNDERLGKIKRLMNMSNSVNLHLKKEHLPRSERDSLDDEDDNELGVSLTNKFNGEEVNLDNYSLKMSDYQLMALKNSIKREMIIEFQASNRVKKDNFIDTINEAIGDAEKSLGKHLSDKIDTITSKMVTDNLTSAVESKVKLLVEAKIERVLSKQIDEVAEKMVAKIVDKEYTVRVNQLVDDKLAKLKELL